MYVNNSNGSYGIPWTWGVLIPSHSVTNSRTLISIARPIPYPFLALHVHLSFLGFYRLFPFASLIWTNKFWWRLFWFFIQSIQFTRYPRTPVTTWANTQPLWFMPPILVLLTISVSRIWISFPPTYAVVSYLQGTALVFWYGNGTGTQIWMGWILLGRASILFFLYTIVIGSIIAIFSTALDLESCTNPWFIKLCTQPFRTSQQSGPNSHTTQ